MKTNTLYLLFHQCLAIFFLITISCSSVSNKQMTKPTDPSVNNDKMQKKSLVGTTMQNDKELIVQLDAAITPAIWIQKYSKYNTTLVEPISTSSNINLVSFDATSIDSERFIKLLSRDKSVIKVQTNDKIKGREETQEMSDLISNQVLLHLATNTIVKEWLKGYEKHNLLLLDTISKRSNIYLFSFDEEKITTEDILKIFNRDKQVKKAEINKKIKSR